MMPVRSRMLGAVLCSSLVLGSVGCGDEASFDEESLALGEATAALSSSEEPGEAGAEESVGFASDAELMTTVEEDADATGPVPEGAGAVCDFGAKRSEVRDAYDADGDGRLNRSELAELKKDLDLTRVRPRFARLAWRLRANAFLLIRWAFDEDGDRRLSDEERAALVAAFEQRCTRLHQQALDAFDADGNGLLDTAEREAARQAARARLVAKYQEVLAQYDRNGNGSLEAAERVQLRADGLAQARERRAAVIARYDTDGDGVLSAGEKDALAAAIRQRIEEGRQAP
ncbi:calcium-binding protein [Stigmatella erecta]|uniref:EF hand n=1 Tax=Stigmatella erecta TaxID=83460 RepID=A0A1I0ISP3_9BACT|nr:calcium-binding protein [Stigmatella erecta]SEU00004.1 EF hand [Stigmatella erecta]